MMEYNPKYIHFEHTDDLIGKLCIAADSVYNIRLILGADNDFIKGQLVQIKEVNDNKSFPFKVTCHDKDEPEVTEILMKFVYIDPAFQDMMCDEKVLEWTKLKLGDVIQNTSKGMIRIVTGINSFNTDGHIFAGGWIADKDLKDWEKVDE